MCYPKRYTYVDRNRQGKIMVIREYSTKEEFDQEVEKNPPRPGHVIKLIDTYAPLGPLEKLYQTVREVKAPVTTAN